MEKIDDEFKRQCIVIGAGVGGCAITKECMEQGVDNLCFDRTVTVGGVYTRYAYPDMRFTSSTNTTQFSDFPYKNPRGNHTHHWTPVESIQYLEAYVKHFEIEDRFRFQGQVNSCERLDGGSGAEFKWKVTVEFKNWEKHWTQKEMSKEFEIPSRVEEYYCKHLILACGTHGKGAPPMVDGLDESGLTQIHSSEICYRKDEVKGKNVVQIGLGESGSDIALAVAKQCNHLDVSLRRYPYHTGVYFPKQYLNTAADTFDTRMYYSLNRTLAKFIGNGFVSRFRNTLGADFKRDLHERAIKYNDEIGCPDYGSRNPLNSFGVKNFNILKAEQKYGTTIKPGIEKVEGKTVHYKDGTTFDADVFLYCTGFEPKFEFLPKKYQEIVCCGKMREFWKHMVHPDMGTDLDLLLVGFARPNMTSFWIGIELQARTVAALMKGTLTLPSKEVMIAEAKRDKEFYTSNLGHSARTIPVLVDHHYFNEYMAEYMGASPPFLHLFLTFQWFLLFKLFWCSLNSAHYRFTGPNAKFDVAKDTIMNWTYFYPVSSYWDYLQGYNTIIPGLAMLQFIGLILTPFNRGPIGSMRFMAIPVYLCWAFFTLLGYCMGYGFFGALWPLAVVVTLWVIKFIIRCTWYLGPYFWKSYFDDHEHWTHY